MFEFQSLITLMQTDDKDFDIDTSYKVDVLQGSSTDMDIDTWIKGRITIHTCASVSIHSVCIIAIQLV